MTLSIRIKQETALTFTVAILQSAASFKGWFYNGSFKVCVFLCGNKIEYNRNINKRVYKYVNGHFTITPRETPSKLFWVKLQKYEISSML